MSYDIELYEDLSVREEIIYIISYIISYVISYVISYIIKHLCTHSSYIYSDLSMDGVHFTEDGNLQYDLYNKQRDAIDTFITAQDVDITEFRGGNRSGKSVTGARAIIYAAWNYPDTTYGVIAKTIGDGRRVTYDMLFKNLPGCDSDDPEASPLVAYYNKNDRILKLVNGSKIMLSTAEDYDELMGSELNGVWIDEGALIPNIYELLDNVLTRFSVEPRFSVIISTTPDPNTPAHQSEYHSIFVDGENPTTEESLNWEISTVTASLLDNPFISDSVKESYQRKYEGNSTVLHGGFSANVDGLVYDAFTHDTHVLDVDAAEAAKNNAQSHYYGYDSGYRDPRVILHVVHTNMNEVIVVDEFYESESYVEDAIEWIKTKPHGKIISEHEPEEMQKFAQRTHHTVMKAQKSIDKGIESVRSRLRADHEGNRGLFVSETCERTISEFDSYQIDDVGGSDVDDHAMDTLRYIIYTNRKRFGSSKGNTPSNKESKIKHSSVQSDISDDPADDFRTIR